MKLYTLIVETLERRRFMVEGETADAAMATMDRRLQEEDLNVLLDSGELLQQTHRIKTDYMKTVRT